MKLLYPVDLKYKISQGFGWRIHPVTGKKDFHTGIDIACPSGTPIKASENGVVLRVWWDKRNGLALRYRLENEKIYMIGLAHLSEVLVGPGDEIKKGQSIAFSGNSGLGTGAHLHFTLRKNNEPINPLPYLIMEENNGKL